MRLFEGKVALVTGGGSGIGRCAALSFAAEGARVAVADLSSENGEETVELIRSAGGQAFFVQTDVSQMKDVELMVRRTVETYGSLDCALNSAGINGGVHNLASCTEGLWDKVMDINLKGTFLCMKYEIMQMSRHGIGGSVVNVSSNLGLVGSPGQTAYVASKHGVVGLTKSAALEYAKKRIRVNVVAPCNIDTPMCQRLIADNPGLEFKKVLESGPMGRMGKPEEIAAAVIWLCSDAASFVTGHCLAVDGGMLAA